LASELPTQAQTNTHTLIDTSTDNKGRLKITAREPIKVEFDLRSVPACGRWIKRMRMLWV